MILSWAFMCCVHIRKQETIKTGKASRMKQNASVLKDAPLWYIYSLWVIGGIFCGPVNDELFCADVGIRSKLTLFHSYSYFFFGFHKVRGISWLSEDLLASQEGLCSMELVSYFMSLYVCTLCIELMHKWETIGCVLRVTHPENRLYRPTGLVPQRAILARAFWCILQS
jgi:hypothetical protein